MLLKVFHKKRESVKKKKKNICIYIIKIALKKVPLKNILYIRIIFNLIYDFSHCFASPLPLLFLDFILKIIGGGRSLLFLMQFLGDVQVIFALQGKILSAGALTLRDPFLTLRGKSILYLT